MKTYLFDFDGTLVDSMPCFIEAMLKILDDNGVKYPENIINIITPLGFLGTSKYFKQELGLTMSEEELLVSMKAGMLNSYLYTIPAKNNVEKVLKELKQGGASINVLTASPHVTLDACLKRLKMFDLFDNVWSCDDFNTSKADPEIYKMVAKKLGVKVESVLFLDDNLGADMTAKSAGMKVCGVYDASSADSEPQMRNVCDYYITDFIELLDIDF